MELVEVAICPQLAILNRESQLTFPGTELCVAKNWADSSSPITEPLSIRLLSASSSTYQ